MDNQVFRETYSAINERYCPFEKSILTNQCACRRAERFCIAEREGVHCKADAAQARCVALLDILRAQARFALRTTESGSALPHAKAMRVQVGGLRGLHALLDPQAEIPSTIDDIDALVESAIARFGRLEDLSFQVIVQQIAAYRGRRPFRERRR
ncbi:MAG: hypothetical protein ACLFNA_08020 [Halochromatium sp.]|uniref:hypothetical protein n=1 Tax=Halochromatium sp. TaxID=2049430 RepID=UPI00397D2F93